MKNNKKNQLAKRIKTCLKKNLMNIKTGGTKTSPNGFHVLIFNSISTLNDCYLLEMLSESFAVDFFFLIFDDIF